MRAEILHATTGLRPRAIQPNEVGFRLLLTFSLCAMAFGFLLNTPYEILVGTGTILTSPSVLLTDYMAIANPGATIFNAGLIMLIYVLYIRLHHNKFTGPLVAGLFTVFGFAFFGKNLLNSAPITLGVFLWARLERKPESSNYLVASLFGTAMGPAVSFVIFGKYLPLYIAIPFGIAMGVAIGLAIPPLAAAFINFHHGLSLYNVGFTAGIIGMVVIAIYRLFHMYVPDTFHEYTGDNWQFMVFLLAFCLAAFLLGFYYNGYSLRGMAGLMRRSGQVSSDFFALEGLGRTFMNMAFMGLIAVAIVVATGGYFNGPVLGGIFTVIGFSAFGKHPRNTLPVIIGVIVGAMLLELDLGSTPVLVVVMFGTSLAPIAGVYGPIAGLIAGWLHMGLVSNVAFLHGGLNLYNNGFSTGFVALTLIPMFNAVYRIRGKTPPDLTR